MRPVRAADQWKPGGFPQLQQSGGGTGRFPHLSRIVIEASTRLAPQAAGLHKLAQQRTRFVLRIAEALVQHLHDRYTCVEPDEVGECERAHRMGEAELR